MDTKTIRAWVDLAGPDEVANLCGVKLDTVARWAAGKNIPQTRRPVLMRIYLQWLSEQQAAKRGVR